MRREKGLLGEEKSANVNTLSNIHNMEAMVVYTNRSLLYFIFIPNKGLKNDEHAE